MQRIGTRIVWAVFVLALVTAIAGLLGLDQAVAGSLGQGNDRLDGLVDTLDLVSLKEISNFLPPLLLVLAGWLSTHVAALRGQARNFLYVGAAQLVTVSICDFAKPPFGRLRPYEALAQGGADNWFEAANSFPSGHAGFYAGLVLPLVIAWPRLGIPLLAVPLLVAVQRVMSLNHYASDAAASIAVAAAIALAFRPILPPKPAGEADRPWLTQGSSR